jgi:hypothetical protein
LFVNSFSFQNCNHHGVIPLFALAFGGHFHGIEQASDRSGPQALIDIHAFDRGDDLEFALVGYQPMPDQALAISEFFLMRRVAAAALGDSELPKVRLYSRRATPPRGQRFPSPEGYSRRIFRGENSCSDTWEVLKSEWNQ